MPSTSSLLSNYETCDRKGHWSRSWEPTKLRPTDMVTECLRQALTATEGQPWGDYAGSAMLQLAQDRGMDVDTPRLYPSVMHHAAIADLMVTAIRKPDETPWQFCPPLPNWTSGCFISPDGKFLRRVVVVSSWSDERHTAECRAWASLGEIAHYELPMQQLVLDQRSLGFDTGGVAVHQETNGPSRGKYRDLGVAVASFFRKKNRMTQSETFNDKWEKIYREDHDEISRETWLEAMLKDDVLREVCFREDIPVPPSPHLLRIRQMADKKLDRLYALKEVPEANLSGCDWPVACPYRKLCHVLPEKEPEEKYGFFSIA